MSRICLLILCTLSSSALMAQFAIGHTTITFNDPSRTGGFGSGGGTGRQIQTEIYYPATVSGENTATASGSFPVIVFGHGFAMSWDAYENMWQHLAPQGYILAFPRTEGGLIPAPSHQDFALDLNIVEARMLLLQNQSSSLFYQKINGNTAIMGHSMGGGASFLAAALNTSIKTVIGFAPAETNPSAITAAASVNVPALIFSGSSDGVTPPAQHHTPIFSALSSGCKSFVSLIGGAHCYFANSNFNCDFGESTSSTGISISRTEQQQRTYNLLDPWLAYYLKNDCQQLETFIDLLDDQPTLVAGQTSCSPNPIPVITDNLPILTSSISGVSYQWYLDGNPLSGEIASTITVNVSGSYVVEVWFADGCSQSSLPFNATVNALDELGQDLKLFPNPVKEVLNISGGDGQILEYRVCDLRGTLLTSGLFIDEIRLVDLNAGTYFLQVGNRHYRFIKE